MKMRGINFCHSFIGGTNQREDEVGQGAIDVGKATHQMTYSVRKVNHLVHRLARLHKEPIMN